MLYSTIRSKFDTCPNEHEDSWETICSQVTRPRVFPVRDAIPLWRFVTLNGREGRTDDVCQETTAVTVEYDDSPVSIEEFITRYSARQFALYTTPSHTPEAPRFRAVFPLATSVLFKDAKLIRAKLNKLFQGCDESSMSNWQRIPGVTPTTALYQYYTNDVPDRLNLDASIRAARMTAAADAGLLAARRGQEEARVRRMGRSGEWTAEGRRKYCEDKLGPKLKALRDQIPPRSGRHQALMNFITYMAALTWPGTDIKIYSERDAETWLRSWFCIGDRAVERKINSMIIRFFSNRR